MIIKRRIFEKYNDYQFSIPVEGRDRVYVQKGQSVSVGDELYKNVKNNVKETIYVPEEISCNLNTVVRYLACIDGEYVEEGSTLAEKTVSNGLFTYRLLSPTSGVVDLSRIETGFLNILGEESSNIVKSSFNGIVKNVDPVDGITITSDAYALDLLAMSNIPERKENRKVTGEFLILGEDDELKYRADDEDYRNKVVFVGKRLHPNLLQELFEKGASFVLTSAMNYQEFRELNLPVGVIESFGDVYSNEKLVKDLYKFKDSFVVLDWEESQAFFLMEKKVSVKEQNLFVQNLIGSEVISKSSANYGIQGKIVEIQNGGEYVTVEWSNKSRGLVHVALLEFISI